MQPSIEDTIAFIRMAHAGQVDKAGKPYHLHPEAVSERLGPDATDDERRVALLHDVIEDTAHTADDLLSMGFSRDVVAAVQALSRPEGENRPTYLDWIRNIAASGNRMVIRVKIADNEENSSPERVAVLPVEERDIVNRYRRSLAILRPALAQLT